MPTKIKPRAHPPARQVTIEPDAVYNYAEAAEILKVTERQVRRWVAERRIGYVQLPQCRHMLGRHILAFIAGNEVEPEAEA